MSLFNSPRIITEGLVFCYDMSNKKSWKGKPTTNYIYHQNPRLDSSYALRNYNPGGTYAVHHADAIIVYNSDGSDITAYDNSGVTDWTNAYHAMWTYDKGLEKPVVTMRDIDGSWKAKYMGVNRTFNEMGLAAGSTYTISWLQWTTDITKSANAGIYSRNASDSWNFWDGLSNSYQTSFNTKARTWQRVYATFTLSSGLNMNAGVNLYMYGQGTYATIKIADVQLEAGTPSEFQNSLTRSNTQAIVDLIGNNTITATNLTYNSDNTFSFNGSTNLIQVPSTTVVGTGALTLMAWINGTTGMVISSGTLYGLFSEGSMRYWYWSSTTGGWINYSTTTSIIPYNTWTHIAVSHTPGSSSLPAFFVNGVQYASTGSSPTPTNAGGGGNVTIGEYSGYQPYSPYNGKIASVQIYNRALSAAEVSQNFNATRRRYGL